MEQKKCWELLAEKFLWFQTLRNNTQQHLTTWNRVCKQTQQVTSNNVGSCWPTMLRPFAWGLRRIRLGIRKVKIVVFNYYWQCSVGKIGQEVIGVTLTLIVLLSCVGYLSSSSSLTAALPRKTSIVVPGGRRPWYCCHLSAWLSKASKRDGGTTETSPERAVRQCKSMYTQDSVYC